MGRKTRVIKVGNLEIGGNNPIIIQSMTNTNSADVEATARQINELEKAGCQLVRMTINNIKAAEAIKEIKKGLIFLWLQIYILIIDWLF